MKLGLFLLIASISMGTMADVRIELGPNGYDNVGDNYAHAPYDANDTDNEIYFDIRYGAAHISNGGATASAEAKTTKFMRDERMMPPPLQGVRKFVLTSDDVAENCTIEANGTTYTSADWRVVFNRQRQKLTVETLCYDGQAN